MMKSLPRSTSTASGRSTPWVSEINPTRSRWRDTVVMANETGNRRPGDARHDLRRPVSGRPRGQASLRDEGHDFAVVRALDVKLVADSFDLRAGGSQLAPFVAHGRSLRFP